MRSVKSLCSTAGWTRLVDAALSRKPPAPRRNDAGDDVDHPARVLPETGVKLADAQGAEWVVRAVFYDEAGPARIVVIPSADLASGRLDAAFALDVPAWCAFLAGKRVTAA